MKNIKPVIKFSLCARRFLRTIIIILKNTLIMKYNIILIDFMFIYMKILNGAFDFVSYKKTTVILSHKRKTISYHHIAYQLAGYTTHFYNF